jgi:hypothetical protein
MISLAAPSRQVTFKFRLSLPLSFPMSEIAKRRRESSGALCRSAQSDGIDFDQVTEM